VLIHPLLAIGAKEKQQKKQREMPKLDKSDKNNVDLPKGEKKLYFLGIQARWP
jgi:hypothetical protein